MRTTAVNRIVRIAPTTIALNARQDWLMARKRPAHLPHPPHFLKEWREERQLTQDQLGDRVGLTHSSISRLETGQSKLTEHAILKLARALQITPGDLFRSPLDEDGVWSLALKISRLPPDQRLMAMRMIDALGARENQGDGES